MRGSRSRRQEAGRQAGRQAGGRRQAAPAAAAGPRRCSGAALLGAQTFALETGTPGCGPGGYRSRHPNSAAVVFKRGASCSKQACHESAPSGASADQPQHTPTPLPTRLPCHALPSLADRAGDGDGDGDGVHPVSPRNAALLESLPLPLPLRPRAALEWPQCLAAVHPRR